MSSRPRTSQSRARSSASATTDPQTLHILKKFGLDEIMPQPQDFASARAELLPLDGSTPIFAGGKPITRRRESSSPAVTEALARGFKLTHFPARALLPEDQFASHRKNTLQQQNYFDNVGAPPRSSPSVSPDPRLQYQQPQASAATAASLLSSSSIAEIQQRQQRDISKQLRQESNSRSPQQTSDATSHYAQNNPARIPPNIDPHVLPQGALMQPLPPARELYETHVPLQQTTKFDATNERWLHGVDTGDWALSDPVALTSMARIYRRCFPRTERDDQHDEFPTSNFAGNYILKRYGGCFPEHCHYSFYRKYGEHGQGAVSSEYHNFPAGRHPLAPI